MFHTFNNQEDRRKFGGTAFLELQYCRMRSETKIDERVSVSAIENWKNDSLYVYIDDMDDFISQYSTAFGCGTYNNLETGCIDIYGINYYSMEQVNEIIENIVKDRPKEYEVLLAWLNGASAVNGFYVLGI